MTDTPPLRIATGLPNEDDTTAVTERDQFYKDCPWVFARPEHPQCSECWKASSWEVRDTRSGQRRLFLIETHNEDCSRSHKNGEEHVFYPRQPTCKAKSK